MPSKLLTSPGMTDSVCSSGTVLKIKLGINLFCFCFILGSVGCDLSTGDICSSMIYRGLIALEATTTGTYSFPKT